jgi:hypothetical protein
MQITQPGGLQTVSVDGVTITGNGTPASPLVGASATPAGWPLTWWTTPVYISGTAAKFAFTVNQTYLYGLSLPAQVRFKKLKLNN